MDFSACVHDVTCTRKIVIDRGGSRGGGGGGGWRFGLGDQGGCERRIGVFVKIQKKKLGEGGGGGGGGGGRGRCN